MNAAAIKQNPDPEAYVNVPLKQEVKSALQERATENGRNMGREAAVIITKSVMRGKSAAS